MLENTSFTFNGIDSESMGVFMINNGNGLYQDIFLPNRSIVETSTPNKNIRYLKRVEKEPLSFPLSIYINNWKEWSNLRSIIRWLDQDEYCEFWVNDDPERIFYVMVEGSSELLHNGCKEGYATMTLRSLYPFALSPTYMETLEVDETDEIILNNDGDATIRPHLTITKIGDGDISILNESNNQEFVLIDLYDGEEIEVDCTNEEIKSSLEEVANRYLFDNHNDVWLDLDMQTDSRLIFTGDFTINITYQLVYKNELT